MADVEATLNEAKWSLGLGALLASLIAVGFALFITRRTLRPLVQVQSAAETVAASQDLSVRIPEGRPDEVGRLARSVNQMLERLEDAQGRLTSTLDEQRRFAADASHELRTPLTALKGDIDLLARYRVPEEEREVVLAEMRASVERMGRMVEGLLALARAEATGGASAAPVDLTSLVGEIAGAGESELAEPLVVRAEPEALRAIFSNLVANGRRFGEVRVTGRADGDWAVVLVADDGPGVDEADRERIFDRFYRAPALRGTLGSGLGLAIARSAAERSGGSLILLPGEGLGARFEVRLPLAGTRAARRQSEILDPARRRPQPVSRPGARASGSVAQDHPAHELADPARGSARPPLAFIAWPTKKPTIRSLPSRSCVACAGFSATSRSTRATPSPSSDIWPAPFLDHRPAGSAPSRSPRRAPPWPPAPTSSPRRSGRGSPRAGRG